MTDNAVPATTDRMVEAAAEALYKYHEWGIDSNGVYYENNHPWDSIGDHSQAGYRDMARVALSAALPHMGTGQAEARIAELEAERDFARSEVEAQHDLWNEARDQRDAARDELAAAMEKNTKQHDAILTLGEKIVALEATSPGSEAFLNDVLAKENEKIKAELAAANTRIAELEAERVLASHRRVYGTGELQDRLEQSRTSGEWALEESAGLTTEVQDIDQHRQALQAAYAERLAENAHLQAQLAAAKGEHGGGWFWSQAEWSDWSNRLALLLPDGYDDDVAQEAIIERALADLVTKAAELDDLRERLAQKIEAEKDVTTHLRGLEALDTAARIVRGTE